MVGCSEDFLDAPKPTDGVPGSVVFNSRKGTEAYISGILRRFRTQYTNTDSAGVNSLFFARSVKGNDIIQAATWFRFDYEHENREPTFRRVSFTWNYCFDMIKHANALISGVENSNLSVQDKKELAGQGYALRAFFYHHLVLEFSKSYAEGRNNPAPPIYTALAIEGKPMSTVGEVYDLIVSDLTKAVADCSDQRLGKSYVNKKVANALLAQVYQVMGNWEGAENAAIAAYGGNVNTVLDASQYGNGFSDYENTEWLWGSPQSTDQSNYYYGAPHSMTDHYTTSYSATYINRDFVNQFSATDVRKLFARKSASITNLNDFRYWITSKFVFKFDSDHPIIRYPELILIEAEAKFHLGKVSEAHDLLFLLQSNRDANAVKSSNTGQALLEEILLERRKELYCENGVEWFDAKRLRRPITRTGNHRVSIANTSLTADDKRFYLKIPQAEIDANPFIDESVNDGR